MGLDLDVAYTLLDATLDAQEPVSAYKYGLNSARHHVQGSASMTSGPVTLGLQGAWKDRLRDAPLATNRYGVVHGRVGYRVQVGGAPITLSAEVRNMGDVDYSDVFDAPMPGRTLLVETAVQL